MVFDEVWGEPLDGCKEEGFSSSLAHNDDENALWHKFEMQCEGYWEDEMGEESYSFAEDGLEEVTIPPKASHLIDSFSSLQITQKDHLLELVKQLIACEINR